jgi:hypothetical protein
LLHFFHLLVIYNPHKMIISIIWFFSPIIDLFNTSSSKFRILFFIKKIAWIKFIT